MDVATNANVPIETAHSNGKCVESSESLLEELRSEFVNGLLYAHTRANANTSKLMEAASFSYALIELLHEKGIIGIAELEARKDIVAERLTKRFRAAGMGAMLQDPEQDKYQFDGGVRIDCENRLHLCKAACCKLAFALSRQDVEEGVVKWEFGHPYMNARSSDGYCVHLHSASYRCTIYENRPLPCRAYDCRQDKRIWLDFDKQIVNPDLATVFDNHQNSESIG